MNYSDFEDRARDLLAHDKVAVDTAALVTALGIVTPKRRKGAGLWLVAIGVVIAAVAGLAYTCLPSATDASSAMAGVTVTTSQPLTAASTASISTTDVEDTDLAIIETTSDAFIELDEVSTSAKAFTAEAKSPLTSTSPIATNPLSTSMETSNIVVDPLMKDRRADNFELLEHQQSTINASEAIDVDWVTAAAATTAAATEELSTARLPTRSLITAPEALGVMEETKALSMVSRNELAPSKDKIKCPSFKIGGSRLYWSLIPEIGYMVADQDLQDLSQEIIPSNQVRMQHEQALEGIQAALYGKVMHEKLPLYLKAGLSYSRISHRMPLSYERIERDTTQGIISLTTSPTGDTITAIIGDIVTETMVTGNTTKHYYTHQWDLPIAIGYERPLGPFTLGIEGGLHVNLRTSVTGSILRTASEFGEALTAVDVDRRVGLGLFGGVQLSRYFDGLGEFYLAARARSIPDISPQLSATDQSYMLYGLHVGYVVHF